MRSNELNSAEIRESFLSFFESKGCRRQPRSSLIPDDPSLLLTSAGMVQFKPVFLGAKNLGFTRATTVQKCVRTTDIDIIGTTGRHHSFFEMLGNFSFGDYFKCEAAAWAWEYSTEVLGLDPDRIWITDLRGRRRGRGDLGRRGRLPARAHRAHGRQGQLLVGRSHRAVRTVLGALLRPGPGAGLRQPGLRGRAATATAISSTGTSSSCSTTAPRTARSTPLPKQNIDTGMGLERIAAILQGVHSNFETDILRALMELAEEITGASYGTDERTDTSLRILADHARAVTFLIADGVLPSNEGRGYVLRRLLRRAVRHGRLLGVEDPFLTPTHRARHRARWVRPTPRSSSTAS